MIDLGDIFSALLDLATSLPPWRCVVGLICGLVIGFVLYMTMPPETWRLPLSVTVFLAGLGAGMLWDSKARST